MDPAIKLIKMARGGERRKMRRQCASALEDLEKAEKHLVYIQALAKEQSEDVNKFLPQIVLTCAMLIEAVKGLDGSL